MQPSCAQLGWRSQGLGRRGRERGEVGVLPAVLCAGSLWLGASACPQIPSTQALFCALSALFPWPCWHLQLRAGGSLGLWLPGDSTFTNCRLVNPTGPALGHSVCALLQSDQSYFPTQFLLLDINQSKRAAWTDHCH